MSLADEKRFTVLPIPDLATPISIDYDYETKKIYWYDLEDRAIYRSYLNGSELEIFVDDIRGKMSS